MSTARFGLRPGLARLLVAVTTVVGAASAQAEGAVKLLDCGFVGVCDAAGTCSGRSGEAHFRMEPTQLEAGGRGSYRISYGDTVAEMEAISDSGPFFWTVGRNRHALIASSATEWLWHELPLEAGEPAAIRFLRCTFQQ